MIHISDLSWTRKHSHPAEALQKSQDVKCIVLEVNEDKRRISLGIKQMTEDPWIRAIPEKYIPGHIIKGIVAKITNFGAFVELEKDLEGLLHISELADHKVDKPQDVVKVGDELEVKILKVDTDSRKIGLSLRRVQWAAEEQASEPVEQKTPTGPEKVLSDAHVEQLTKARQKKDSNEPDDKDETQIQESADQTVETQEEIPQEEPVPQAESGISNPEISEQSQGEQSEDNTETEEADAEEETEQKTD